MRYGSADVTLLMVDGADLLPAKLQSLVERREGIMERADGLGDRTEAQSPTGLTKITLAQAGAFFDDRANGFHDAFKTDGRSRTMMYSVSAGKHVTTISGVYRQSYDVVAQQGRLTRANVTYQVNGIPDDTGRVLQPTATFTAGWNTNAAPLDLGVPTTNDAMVTVIVSDMITFTSLALTVFDSADGLTGWASVKVLPAITTSPSTTVVQLAPASPLRRYVSITGLPTPVGAGSVRVTIILKPM